MANYARVARRIRVPLGFVFAALYLWFARPTWASIAAGSAIAASGVWLRALASGHVKKNEELTTTGPYAHTRNPLYLGSILIGLGFALASLSVVVALLLVLLFVLIYVPVVRSEEAYLSNRFPGFAEYAAKVPRFGWRFTTEGHGKAAFSGELYRKHREYNALIGAVLMVAALVAKMLLFPR